MNEISRILAALRESPESFAGGILATVVDVKGSAYRRTGARMLASPDGKRIGSVSGGCLEGDILQKGWWWTESGAPVLRVYDTSADPDTAWELGLGCNGTVRVLLERLGTGDVNGMFAFLAECERTRTTGSIATVISSPAGSSAEVGMRLFVSEDRELSGTLAHTPFCDAARLAATYGGNRVIRLEEESAEVEVFVESIAPVLPLVIFGGGHDAVPLVEVGKLMGWLVTVADGRPAFAQSRRFPLADAVVLTEPSDLLKSVRVGGDSAVVVMNHSYAVDREIVRQVLGMMPLYLGVLGPRARTEKMLAELAVTELPGCFHAPVGLDLGADTPEGIALSIAAEIQAVVAGRNGGKLRDRRLSIYAESSAPR